MNIDVCFVFDDIDMDEGFFVMRESDYDDYKKHPYRTACYYEGRRRILHKTYATVIHTVLHGVIFYPYRPSNKASMLYIVPDSITDKDLKSTGLEWNGVISYV